MRHLKFLSAITLSGLLLAGCASVAHVEKDDSVNFSKYHSYTWVEAKATKNDSGGSIFYCPKTIATTRL